MSQGTMTQAESDERLSTWLARPEVSERIGTALGGYLNHEMFISHYLIHIQSKPELAACSVASQYQAIHICAMLGLLAGYQQVALIPRAKQLTVMPQWQGLKALMERHPDVAEVVPMLVGINDQFVTDGDGPDMYVPPGGHRFDPLARSIKDLPDIRGGYVKVIYHDGRMPKFHFVTAEYIGKCRACAQTQNVWKAWFEQQALKTLLRSAYARRVVPIDPMVAGRVEAFLKQEDSLLGNDPRIIEHQPAGPALPAVSRSQMLGQQLAARRTGLTGGALYGTNQPPQTTDQSLLPQEPVSGETTGEPESSEPAKQQSLMSEFIDLLAETKTRRDVERLHDHYLSDEAIATSLTSEERDAVRDACESKLKEFPAPSVPAKPAERKTKNPLTP